MYYIGTKSEIESYIKQVDEGEKYKGTTNTWAIPFKSLEDINKYAVIKHDKYEHSTMQLVETLPSEFVNTEL